MDPVDILPALEQAFALDMRALQETHLFEGGVDAFEMGGFHARYVRGEVVAQRVEKEIHRLAEAHIAVFLVDVGEGGVDVRKVADGLAVQVAQAVRAVQFGISRQRRALPWMPEPDLRAVFGFEFGEPCLDIFNNGRINGRIIRKGVKRIGKGGIGVARVRESGKAPPVRPFPGLRGRAGCPSGDRCSATCPPHA